MAVPNPAPQAEYTVNYELGYNGDINHKLRIQAALFYSKIHNTILMVSNVKYDSVRRVWQSQLQNRSLSEYLGAQAGLEYQLLPSLKTGANYTRIRRNNLSNPALHFIDVPEHNFFGYALYSLKERLSLQASTEYNSKRFSTTYGAYTGGYAFKPIYSNKFMIIARLYAVIILASISCQWAKGQPAAARPSVKVSGEVTKPLTLYVEDLGKMKQIPVEFKDRGGNLRHFTGVSLLDILGQAGVTLGKELRGENLTKYMMVKCADGYEVLFSLAEFDSSFTDRKIALVFQSDGKPLSATEGPFRVIVPGEKKPARSCLQVTELVIRYARE